MRHKCTVYFLDGGSYTLEYDDSKVNVSNRDLLHYFDDKGKLIITFNVNYIKYIIKENK